MSPFEKFFRYEFGRELATVQIPHKDLHYPEGGEPSWDRKAAWLLWCERNLMDPEFKKTEEDDDY